MHFLGRDLTSIAFLRTVNGQSDSTTGKAVQLKGEMPPELQHLTSLQRLLIPDMGLTGRLLELLTKMSKLETLSVPQNKFSGSIPDTFSADHALLASIDLSSNAFTGQIPLSFGRFEYLYGLDLSSNNLHGSIPSELGNITALRKCAIPRILGSISTNLCEAQYSTFSLLSKNLSI